MLFPNELWSMILGHNYEAFCVEVSITQPWTSWKSWNENRLITETIVGHLLRKIDVNDNSIYYGWAPLMCAYQPSVVQLLIENGANVSATSHGGWTPLICALSKLMITPSIMVGPLSYVH